MDEFDLVGELTSVLEMDDGALPGELDAQTVVNNEYRCDGFVCKFDFWSHSSGHRRGYTRCFSHTACFRYAQLRKFDSERACAAYLIAWAKLGSHHSREEHVSARLQPTDACVQEIFAQLA